MSSYSEYLGRKQQRLQKFLDTRPHRDAGHQTEVVKRLAASGVQESRTPASAGVLVLNGPSTQVKSFYSKAHTVQDTAVYNEYTSGQAVAQSAKSDTKTPQISQTCYSSTVVPEINDRMAADTTFGAIYKAKQGVRADCCSKCGHVVQASVCGCTNRVPSSNVAVVGFQGIII
jgi:hypothetical protein